MPQNVTKEAVKVVCEHCPFERVVDDEDVLPADVIISHGRETGHKLSVERPAPA